MSVKFLRRCDFDIKLTKCVTGRVDCEVSLRLGFYVVVSATFAV